MFLIDGYNLLHCFARGKAGGPAREKLISLVHAYCVAGNYRVRIVFDPTGGMKRNDRRGPLEIRNVPPGQTADAEILEAIRSTPDRLRYTVVSNDQAIVREARKRHSAVVGCEEFVRSLTRRPEPPEKGGAAPPGEVDYWMREFGLEDEPPP